MRQMVKFGDKIVQKIVFIVFFCLLMIPASAFGHKLIPTDGTNVNYDSALEIPNPVISWAMYEELQEIGRAHV